MPESGPDDGIWRCSVYNLPWPRHDQPHYCPLGGCSKEDGCAREKLGGPLPDDADPDGLIKVFA